MAGICFFFESYDIDVWSGRRIDLDAWNYACKAAGDIDRIVVVNRTASKISTPDRRINFECIQPSMTGDPIQDLPKFEGKVAYVCCPWDTANEMVSLWEFDHDVDWYVFGPASGWRGKIEGLGLYIPQAGQAATHSVHVASTILMHRYSKVGG